jgi:hypothetical protein
MKPNRKISNPRGVGDSKRIGLSLMPNEMAKIERLAEKSGVSKSRIARSLVLKGLQSKNPTSLQDNVTNEAA